MGADEPRYAQIAHEMLDRFDSAHTLKGKLSACVTPYLYGHPWLEKPALYYWRAMFVFQEFGVHDWSARLPSASFAFIMVGADLPAHAAIPTRRAPGRGADHGGLRGHHRLFARRVDRHADGRAAVASACWAGMRGTKPIRSSGCLIFTSLPASPRWPKGRWRRSWPS